MKRYVLLCCISSLLLMQMSLRAGTDTCTVNDICNTAIAFPDIISDETFFCIDACNIGAQPETEVHNNCFINQTPTVWFKVFSSGNATLLNIYVSSVAISAPVIAMFKGNPDCSSLTPVALTATNVACVVGSDGVAEAIGNDIGSSTEYYIAISSETGETGDFEICINTISVGSVCTVDRNIEITARSFDGPLTGPFYPGEEVSFCLNVLSYTAVGNGCQWFQGLVPVFGDGWDPSSFDMNGQPINARVNEMSMGVPANGLYGTSTWDWFTDVDYHHEHEYLQIGDFDNSGSLDMCNTQYEFECTDLGGLPAACCGPCWDAQSGAILPGGWFAYGINGSCAQPGPPIRVDWGDGNTCAGGMGPWSFCFDLTIRPFPECLDDAGLRTLSVAFFTQADGEVGAWTGGSSVCALDQPAKVTLPLKCIENIINLGVDTLVDLCEGDSMLYEIMHDSVSTWTWTISPMGYIQDPEFSGPNGFTIEKQVLNPGTGPQYVTFSFTGRIDGSTKVVLKKVIVRVWPGLNLALPRDLYVCEKDSAMLVIIPELLSGGTGNYTYSWTPSGSNSPELIIGYTGSTDIELIVIDEAGCTARDEMRITLKPCFGDDEPTDDNNDPPKPQDPPLPGGNLTDPDIIERRSGTPGITELLVFPVPTRDQVMIALHAMPVAGDVMYIVDIHGHIVRSLHEEHALHRHMRIDVSGLPSGVYYIHYRTRQSTRTSRMIKM